MILSIIIPIYNVEQYIDQCIQSIINQVNDDTEIILVNDGSTDNSKEKCKLYVSDKVILINQVNMGLSEARNSGIMHSRGEYIMFVDSDDYIKSDVLNEFYMIIETFAPDVIIGRGILLYEDGSTKEKTRELNFKNKMMDTHSYITKAIKRNEITMCAPMNIYKKSLVIENHIYFRKAILHEDELWTPMVLCKSKSIYYSAIPFYYHRQRIGSITKSRSKDNNVRSLIQVFFELKDYLLKCNNPIKFVLLDRAATLYLSTFYISKINELNYEFSSEDLRGMGFLLKTKLKIILFSISQKLYYKINRVIKNGANR